MSTDASSSNRPKRQLVKAACQSCQKRKVKCSGERPMCMLCQQRNQPCVYDSEAGISRVEAVRRRNKELVERNSDFELVYTALRTTSESEAFNHLRRLRESPDVESYARTLRGRRPPTRKRPPDNVSDFMEDGGLLGLSPISARSQDQQDSDINSYGDPRPASGYASPPQQPPMMIDPLLGQQTLYSFSNNESTMQSLAEVWPFQNTTQVHQDTYEQDWARPDMQAGPSNNHYLYNVPMPQHQTNWSQDPIDPATGQPRRRRQQGFDG